MCLESLIKKAQLFLQDKPYFLLQKDDYLTLINNENQSFRIDFLSGKNDHRRRFGGGQNQPLVKACLSRQEASVFDISAGLGRDAFVLASHGSKVTLFERNPVIAALLADALRRLKQSELGKALNLELHYLDAMTMLNTLSDSQKPEVIYFDPMHPKREKSALVKKDLRLVAELVGDDLDKQRLFEKALKVAKKRVVLKWPAKAPLISSKKPSFVYQGSSTRFEVYLV